MRLKELELFGFKSFPARTSLSFDSGITSVVGPNGCGKSNIVDSIRWVLGEQSAKSLRGDRMEAVIFSGSNKRNPASLSEVSLVVESNHEISGNGYSQTKVTRRLYRNGESEYLLNGVPCLLRDISELFADTGIGASAYMVMEQQMVESLISDKDENRREVFDEAAGITKYKLKRRLAQRKLDNTQADLLRLTDLVAEVEKQVGSLKRQMKKAEGYKKLKDELKELELKVGRKQLQDSKQRLAEIESKLGSYSSAKESGSAELSTQELELENLKLELLSVERQVDAAREDLDQITARMFKEQESIAVNRQKMENLKENSDRLLGESGLLSTQRAEFEKAIVQKHKETSELSERLEKARAENRIFEENTKGLQNQVEALRVNLNQLSQTRTEQALRLQQMETEVQNLVQRSIELEQRERELEQYRRVKQDLENQLRRRMQDKDGEIQRLESRVRELGKQKQSLTLQAGQSERKIESAEKEIADLQARLAAEKSRREVLVELWKSYSDYQQGVKSLIGQKEKFGLIDTVANLLKTEETYLAAVEAALGEKAGFLVAQDWNCVLSAIKELGQRDWGEAGLVTAGTAPGQAQRVGTSLIEGLIPLSRIVKSDGQKMEKLAAALLDKIYLVDSVQQAHELLARLPFDIVLVTKQGEIFSPAGFAKGGKRKGSSLLGRQEQIQRAEKDIQEYQSRLVQLTQDKESDKSLLAAHREKADAIEAEVEKLELVLNHSRLEQAESKAQEKHLLEGLTDNQEEQGRIDNLKQSLEQQLTLLQSEVPREKESLKNLDRKLVEQGSELQKSEVKFSLANQRLYQMVVELVTLEGQKERVESDALRLGEAVLQSGQNLDFRSGQKVKTEQEIKLAEQAIQASQDLLQALIKQKESKSTALQDQAEKQHRLLEAIQARERELKGLRRTQSESLQEVHQLELASQELRLQHKQIKDRIWEEYEVDLDSVPFLQPQEMEQLTAYIEQISDLKGKLKNYGAVNLLALEEYQREKERYDFLNKQMDDLTAAKETLESTITKINDTARCLFTETFEKVRGNFQEVLANLFEGGEADLTLEPGVDSLEAKIEILAKPRGKKLVTLAQLSGGEKALVAISLLFSVYMVKPSPFCILDEVDAPLDDANIERFIKLVRQFTDRTQFVIITHNKLTMEAADSLYGVTMAEPGESQIVSVRLSREPVSA